MEVLTTKLDELEFKTSQLESLLFVISSAILEDCNANKLELSVYHLATYADVIHQDVKELINIFNKNCQD